MDDEDFGEVLNRVWDRMDENDEEGRIFINSEEAEALKQLYVGNMLIREESEEDPWTSFRFTLIMLSTRLQDEFAEIEEDAQDLGKDFEEDDELTDGLSEEEIHEMKREAKQDYRNAMSVAKLSNDIILFYTLCGGFIEKTSRQLLEDRLIDEEYQGTSKTEDLLKNQMPQGMREDLLNRTGILDEGTTSEMSHIRGIRNSLVHNIEQQQFLEPLEDVSTEIQRTVRTINAIHEALHGEEYLIEEVPDEYADNRGDE